MTLRKSRCSILTLVNQTKGDRCLLLPLLHLPQPLQYVNFLRPPQNDVIRMLRFVRHRQSRNRKVLLKVPLFPLHHDDLGETLVRVPMADWLHSIERPWKVTEEGSKTQRFIRFPHPRNRQLLRKVPLLLLLLHLCLAIPL